MPETDKKLTVSIVIPTYNREQWIGRAIHSVLTQKYTDYEIIVVDDGSTDNTEELIKNIADNRIKYIKCNTNKGANTARNIGVKEAKGDIIMFQDSDDEWLPGKLEKQMLAFQKLSADVGVVYGGIWRIDNVTKRKIYIPSARIKKRDGNIYHGLLKGNFITTQVAAVRAECFKKVGYFDESLPRLQDWDLWIRIARHYKYKYIPEPLVNTYYHSDSISGNYEKLVEAMKLILEKHYAGFMKVNRWYLAKHNYVIGNILYQMSDIIEGRKYLRKAACLCPWNIKYLIAGLLTYAPEQWYNNLAKYKKLLMPHREYKPSC